MNGGGSLATGSLLPFSWELFLAFLLGSILGSFLNVVAFRLPREESLVLPGSRCPRCGGPIAFYDNIPILSWLLLQGRCRRCRGRISWRYPAVEFVTAFVSAALWLRWRQSPGWAAAAVLASGGLIAITLIDWDTFLIPDSLSLGLLAAGLLVSPINPIFASPGGWLHACGTSFRGGLVGFALCWAVAELGERIFKKEAMGGGDIKLLAAVGAWTGGLGAFDCLMVGSLLGSAYGLSQIIRGTLRRSDPIPFGPFLGAGAMLNLFYLLPLGFPFILSLSR